MSPETHQRLQDMLVRHEGMRLRLYKCPADKWTIGIGYNIEDRGITAKQAHVWLEEDIDTALAFLMGFSWFLHLSEVRQAALVDVVFNVGPTKFIKFKKLIDALYYGDWKKAAAELLDSDYARQVGARAVELSDMIKFDVWAGETA